MPIRVVKQGKRWVVMNIKTREVFGRHPNPKRAYQQIAALKHKGVDISGKGEAK